MKPIDPFTISRLPQLLFGDGRISEIPALARSVGRHALLVTGARSLQASSHWRPLQEGFAREGVSIHIETVSGEPSPQWVDAAVARHRGRGIEVVIGIGGGSVLDAGKAVAGLLPHSASVMDFLEGIGTGHYQGPALPYIAAPTTAGTGSEATKNAVLSVQGHDGFKKSFRHECLVPAYAVVDPQLLATCPPAQMAANGMDALTQLIESYVSQKANPCTDALAWCGIAHFKHGFFAALHGGDAPAAVAGRQALAMAATVSGITLAQVGLGSVHGLASPLGAFFPLPHGVVCGTLLAAATDINIRALRQRRPHSPALAKYADLGRLLGDAHGSPVQDACEHLVSVLRDWTQRLALPRLGDYGVTREDFPHIIANCRGNSMKTNPVVLEDGEVQAILEQRL